MILNTQHLTFYFFVLILVYSQATSMYLEDMYVVVYITGCVERDLYHIIWNAIGGSTIMVRLILFTR